MSQLSTRPGDLRLLRLLPPPLGLWVVSACPPTGTGLFTYTAGLQKLVDIIQVGPAGDGGAGCSFPLEVGVLPSALAIPSALRAEPRHPHARLQISSPQAPSYPGCRLLASGQGCTGLGPTGKHVLKLFPETASQRKVRA